MTTPSDRFGLGRVAAAAYVEATHDIPCSVAMLTRVAHNGTGPVYRIVGKEARYQTVDLDEWAQSRISPPIRRASDRRSTVAA